MAYRLAWWCGGICIVCFIVGVPLLGHGAATMPYSLTRDEIAAAGTNQGAYLQQKQENSAAWREVRVGAGFSFTALGVGLLLWCYCAGWLGRIHRRLDPEASPRVAPAAVPAPVGDVTAVAPPTSPSPAPISTAV